jgi:sulfane dehydrogenase subunit SoxC
MINSRNLGSAPAAADTPVAPPALTRRAMLVRTAGVVGGALVAGVPAIAGSQGGVVPPQSTPAPTNVPGGPTSALGARSPEVSLARGPVGEITGSSLTPLQALTGTITPADLHFERHHSGIPVLDAERHSLYVHGLVARPLRFTLADLKRFPQVTRTYLVECSGNGRAAYRDPKPDMTPQQVAGLTSNSEWTGVPLRALFAEAGAKPAATWFLAEGGDASVMTRSIPMAKALDDALVVWAQNGEPLRPAQGYPMRLLLPGWEGNVNVKWLRRLKLGTKPWMTRWETSKYTDPLPDGTARQFSFELDAKSIITSPAFPQVLTRGSWPVTGLAWSGRGAIRRVEVSTDGGRTWHDAVLDRPALPKAHVRFTYPWQWNGEPVLLIARASDETGYVQPSRAHLISVRGIGTDYHFNPTYGWAVAADGRVTFHGATA